MVKDTKPQKPRGDWNGIRPFVRIIESRKKYNRKREIAAFRKNKEENT